MDRTGIHRSTTSTLVIIGGFLLAACSDATSSAASRAVSLSFSSAPASTVAADVATSGADPLVITKAQLVLSRTELGLASTSCPSDNDPASSTGNTSGADDCEALKLGPMLVDLPVAGGVSTPLTVTLPPGTYRKFEARIHAIASASDGDGAAELLAAHPEMQNVSVRVEGTYNGQPFVFTGRVEAKLEMALVPALVVDSASSNLTVHVDLASWFRDGSGASVDPASANDGGANQSLVEGNIKRSFRVFEDRDRDGRDD